MSSLSLILYSLLYLALLFLIADRAERRGLESGRSVVSNPYVYSLSLAVYNQDRCMVQIADRGIGIAAAQQELIFEKFYHAQDNESAKQTGSGLGLTISRTLIDLHHGKLTVKSEPGQGSIFTVSLPLIRDN